jgi:hypothetical protein
VAEQAGEVCFLLAFAVLILLHVVLADIILVVYIHGHRRWHAS